MPNRAAVDAFFENAKQVFWDRNAKYGTRGMSVTKAASLASTKIDRIVNGGELADSTTDLANYALIMSLINTHDWEDDANPGHTAADSEVAIRAVRYTDEPLGLHEPKLQGDVGYDVVVSADTTVPPLPGPATLIPAEVSIEIPDGYWCQIVGRSSASNKKGLHVVTASIDNGYRGKLFACVWNMTGEAVVVKKGERIAQVVFFRAHTFPIREVVEHTPTERGAAGFGSTGS